MEQGTLYTGIVLFFVFTSVTVLLFFASLFGAGSALGAQNDKQPRPTQQLSAADAEAPPGPARVHAGQGR